MTLDEAKITVAIRRLDAIWEQLFPAEQSRIVRLLIEQVIVSPNDLEVRLHANGIERLATEMRSDCVEQPEEAEGTRGERLVASYVSLHIANGGIIMPSFEDANDEDAYEVVKECFPDRRVVQLPVLDILVGGGGIHAVTLAQPATEAPQSD